MIVHTDTKHYNTADEYLIDKIKYVPSGSTIRGDGTETVGASLQSCIRWLKNNRSIVQTYYSYMDVEKEKENEV